MLLGAFNVSTDLNVVGAFNVSTDLNVVGAFNVSTDLNVVGAFNVSTDLNVVGAFNVSTDLNVVGAFNVSTDLNVVGAFNVSTDLNVIGAFNVSRSEVTYAWSIFFASSLSSLSNLFTPGTITLNERSFLSLSSASSSFLTSFMIERKFALIVGPQCVSPDDWIFMTVSA